MNAEQRGLLERFEELCGGHIGNQHALLNQFVGVVSLHGLDGSDFALLIKQDARFLRVEIERTPLLPSAAQHLVKPIEPLNLLTALGGHVWTPAILNDRTDVGIGEPRMGMNHCLVKSVVLQLAVAVNVHVADHRQPIYLRL